MGENNTNAFSAFVSYSHADKTAAQKLHRKLEGYRLPKHVAAQLSDRDDPAKLGQIFRDREDLPAAEDLSESVKAALAQSQALVVLCSPAAKASPWVAREIETFRKLHPNRPVLAALLEGEPEEAFPQPLMQGKEPLAADLRKEGDGPRLGFLKVVAGIAGVPLDALVQRDAQRRVRRVMLITGGAVAAMLAMAIMTVIAIQSRNEAQRQRAEAEGLIEYMLTDLRDDLKGVGRLDVMTDVNERAMDYYEGQGDLFAMPAESLERWARILRTMGEDDEERENFNGALEKYRAASQVTNALLSSAPENENYIYRHAQSENSLGLLLSRQDKWEEAHSRHMRSKTLSDQLVVLDNTNKRWLYQAATSNGDLCAELTSRNLDLDRALKFCLLALSYSKKQVKADPENEEAIAELALRYAWAADALIQTGQNELGHQYHRKHLGVIEGLAKANPEDVRWQEQLMQSYIGFAEMMDKEKDASSKEKYKEKAKKISSILMIHDENNEDWKMWNRRIENIK